MDAGSFDQRPCTGLFDRSTIVRRSAGSRAGRGCRLLTHGATHLLLARGVIEWLPGDWVVLVHHLATGGTRPGGVGGNCRERHAESKRGNAHYHLETHGFSLLAYLLLIFCL
jgi:hypothetical protein